MVLKTLIFDVLDTLLCPVKSVCLGLLNVLFHVLSRVLTCWFVGEEGPLAFLHLLLKEVLKCDLGQEFVVLQRLEHLIFFSSLAEISRLAHVF